MKNEMISIIVPVFNAATYLQECIESILAQTYRNFELILIDDGSTDNSLTICESYKIRSNQIFVIHQENMGVSTARNAGLSVAKGEYFCFVDSDDSVEPDMIEKLYDAIVKEDADISICGLKKLSTKGIDVMQSSSEVIVGQSNISNFVAKHYLEWLVSSPCGKLYKNIYFKTRKFDTKITLGEDLKFNVQYFEHIEKIIIINECLYIYKDTEGSLTKTYRNSNYEAICNIYETTIQYLKRTNINIGNINLKNVNFKLFSFCISFMSQNMLQASFKESIKLITEMCENKLLQQAICDLPQISFVRKIYVWGIKHKFVILLYILSAMKLLIRKLMR